MATKSAVAQGVLEFISRAGEPSENSGNRFIRLTIEIPVQSSSGTGSEWSGTQGSYRAIHIGNCLREISIDIGDRRRASALLTGIGRPA